MFVEEKKEHYSKKDWPFFPILFSLIIGFGWCVIDLISNLETFDWNIWRILGAILLSVGGVIEFWVRMILVNKAKFSNQFSTMLLKINNDHQLVTKGPFKHIRHPMYTGFVLQGIGIGLLSFSIYGSIFLIIGLAFYIPRIQIEENMLIKKFGNKYREYQKKTKKFIPFIY